MREVGGGPGEGKFFMTCYYRARGVGGMAPCTVWILRWYYSLQSLKYTGSEPLQKYSKAKVPDDGTSCDWRCSTALNIVIRVSVVVVKVMVVASFGSMSYWICKKQSPIEIKTLQIWSTVKRKHYFQLNWLKRHFSLRPTTHLTIGYTWGGEGGGPHVSAYYGVGNPILWRNGTRYLPTSVNKQKWLKKLNSRKICLLKVVKVLTRDSDTVIVVIFVVFAFVIMLVLLWWMSCWIYQR